MLYILISVKDLFGYSPTVFIVKANRKASAIRGPLTPSVIGDGLWGMKDVLHTLLNHPITSYIDVSIFDCWNSGAAQQFIFRILLSFCPMMRIPFPLERRKA
jgi:hypothetical protein